MPSDILAAHDLKTLGRCSAVNLGNARGHNHIVQFVIPCKGDIIQNALQGVAAAAGLFKLFCFGQVGHKEERKARALQFQSVALAAGGYDFTDFHIAFGNLVLAFGQSVISMDVVIGAVTGLVDLFTGCLSIVGKGGLFYIPTLIRILSVL